MDILTDIRNPIAHSLRSYADGGHIFKLMAGVGFGIVASWAIIAETTTDLTLQSELSIVSGVIFGSVIFSFVLAVLLGVFLTMIEHTIAENREEDMKWQFERLHQSIKKGKKASMIHEKARK